MKKISIINVIKGYSVNLTKIMMIMSFLFSGFSFNLVHAMHFSPKFKTLAERSHALDKEAQAKAAEIRLKTLKRQIHDEISQVKDLLLNVEVKIRGMKLDDDIRKFLQEIIGHARYQITKDQVWDSALNFYPHRVAESRCLAELLNRLISNPDSLKDHINRFRSAVVNFKTFTEKHQIIWKNVMERYQFDDAVIRSYTGSPETCSLPSKKFFADVFEKSTIDLQNNKDLIIDSTSGKLVVKPTTAESSDDVSDVSLNIFDILGFELALCKTHNIRPYEFQILAYIAYFAIKAPHILKMLKDSSGMANSVGRVVVDYANEAPNVKHFDIPKLMEYDDEHSDAESSDDD